MSNLTSLSSHKESAILIDLFTRTNNLYSSIDVLVLLFATVTQAMKGGHLEDAQAAVKYSDLNTVYHTAHANGVFICLQFVVTRNHFHYVGWTYLKEQQYSTYRFF